MLPRKSVNRLNDYLNMNLKSCLGRKTPIQNLTYDTCIFHIKPNVIAPDKKNIQILFFLFLQKNIWILIGNISLRCFKWVPTTYVFMRKQEKELFEWKKKPYLEP